MTISPMAVRFDEHTMWVDLTDGRTIGVPLAWFPRLFKATAERRERVNFPVLACTGKPSTRTFPSPASWPETAI